MLNLIDNYISKRKLGRNSEYVVNMDRTFAEPFVGVFGEGLSSGLTDDITAQFQYGVSNYDVFDSNTGDGSITVVQHMATCSSGTAGVVNFRSVDTVRYRPGHTGLVHYTALFETGGVAGTTQYIGLMDVEDGIFVGYNGTDFGVGIRWHGTDDFIPMSSWNGDPRAKQVDWSKINIFRIRYGWLGIAPITVFVCLPGSTIWVPLHTFLYQGVYTRPHIGNPVLPISVIIDNGVSGIDCVIKTASWYAGTFGSVENPSDRPMAWAGSTTVDAANKVIANFRSVDVFNGETNKTKSKLLRYQLHVDTPSSGSGTVEFKLIGNATIGGTPSWAAVNTEGVIEFDTAGTYTSGGTMALTEWINFDVANKGGTASGATFSAEQLGLFLYPGNTFTLLANVIGSGTPVVRATFNWIDLF